MAIAQGQLLTPSPPHRAWGQLVTVKLAPAVKEDWVFTAPPGYMTRIVRGTALFTASAEVGERFLAYEITDGVNTLALQLAVNGAAKAGVKKRLNFTRSSSPAQVQPGNEEAEYGIGDMFMPPGFVFRSFTEPLLAGDAWTGVALLVEQFELDNERPVAEVEALARRVENVERAVTRAAG